VSRRVFLVAVWIGSFVAALYLSMVLAIGVWNAGPNGLLISFVVALVSSMIVVRTVAGAIGVSVLRPDPNQRNVGWG
jgi:hypothetical protein